jgi:hypothetical protein
MKKIVFVYLTAILLTMSFSGCKKDVYGCTDPSATNYNNSANVNNGSCTYTGSIIFWTQNVGFTPITVTVSGQTSQVITGAVTVGSPNCGTSGCVTYTLPVGSYTYTASNGAQTWPASGTGTATVVANQCSGYLLN